MPFEPVKWYKRSSVMYAFGMWTLFGTCVYYTIQKKPDGVESSVEEEKEMAANTKMFKTPHTTTTVTYKENFVPYSTRFLNLFQPTAGSTTGSQVDEK